MLSCLTEMTRLVVVLEVVLLLVLCCWRTLSLDQTCSESVQLCYTTLEYPGKQSMHARYTFSREKYLIAARPVNSMIITQAAIPYVLKSFTITLNCG